MNEERLREALEAVLYWHGSYEDYMVGEDFNNRDAAERFARGVLSGDEQITLESAKAQVLAERAERAARGPKIVLNLETQQE